MCPTRIEVNAPPLWTRPNGHTPELLQVLTFFPQQSPHVIGLRVVCIIQDDILHDDAIGFDWRTPMHLHGVWVDWLQPEVGWRRRRP